MKKLLFALSVITPAVLFANSGEHAHTDILERTVNFFIFAAILYYLLADKLKAFFKDRTASIQGELDKVQQLLKESDKKLADAKQEVEDAKRIASELISSANSEVETIKRKIEVAVEQEIASLEKSFEDKTDLETRKAKKEVVENILNQLLSDDTIALSQQDLANIVLKKVA